MDNSSCSKLRSFIVFILIFLYTGSVLSVFLTHTAHELHHLITHTMHLHHNHHHPQSETNDTINNHGHKHGELIDTALQNVNEDDKDSDEHTLVLITLFEHLKVYWQERNMCFPDKSVRHKQKNLILFDQHSPDPPSPPPRYIYA